MGKTEAVQADGYKLLVQLEFTSLVTWMSHSLLWSKSHVILLSEAVTQTQNEHDFMLLKVSTSGNPEQFLELANLIFHNALKAALITTC